MGKVVLLITAIAAIAAASFIFTSSFFLPYDFTMEKEQGLPDNTAIFVKTKAAGFGVHKGDAFPYFVEVWYDPEQVSEIDRTRFDNSAKFKPFEIRNIKERVFKLNKGTKVYQKEYKIQLIDGKVSHVYKFPGIAVQYKRKDSKQFSSAPAVRPVPVFVASRLPPDISGLELRPIKGKIYNMKQMHPSWILLGFGAFLAGLWALDLVCRVIPRWKERAKNRAMRQGIVILSQAYRSLYENVSNGLEPKRLLHQMDRILRVALARKEEADGLTLDMDMVSSPIRQSVISFFEKSEKAYRPVAVDQKDIKEALKQLQEILSFYFGQGEVEAWRG